MCIDYIEERHFPTGECIERATRGGEDLAGDSDGQEPGGAGGLPRSPA